MKKKQSKGQIPGHIYIMGVKFRVDVIKGLAEDGETLDGLTSHEKGNVICLAADLDMKRRWSTFLHECMHAALQVSGARYAIGDDENAEEAVVRALEVALVQILEQVGEDLIKYVGNPEDKETDK